MGDTLKYLLVMQPQRAAVPGGAAVVPDRRGPGHGGPVWSLLEPVTQRSARAEKCQLFDHGGGGGGGDGG